jgi:hypothetical protein
MQNFNEQTTYSSFLNASFNPQFDASLSALSNETDMQDIQVDNTFQVLTMTPVITPITTPPTILNMNENQSLNIQDMTPLQPMQDYQPVPSHPYYSLTHLQKTDVMSEYSFFYAPCNDFQMYYITCNEISFNFESISQLISNNLMNNCDKSENIFVFYHKQPEIRKIFQVTCEMVSHTFLFQYLNKIVFNIQFVNCEFQRQNFSLRHQENLKFHLEKDLIHYLMPKITYNYNAHKSFIQDYRTYESKNNTYAPNHFQQHETNILPFDTSQHNNNCQTVNFQNSDYLNPGY